MGGEAVAVGVHEDHELAAEPPRASATSRRPCRARARTRAAARPPGPPRRRRRRRCPRCRRRRRRPPRAPGPTALQRSAASTIGRSCRPPRVRGTPRTQLSSFLARWSELGCSECRAGSDRRRDGDRPALGTRLGGILERARRRAAGPEARYGARPAEPAPAPGRLHPACARCWRTGSNASAPIRPRRSSRRWQGPTIVTTGTASGKSLAFNLPVLDTLARDPRRARSTSTPRRRSRRTRRASFTSCGARSCATRSTTATRRARSGGRSASART